MSYRSKKLMATKAPSAVLLIRVAVGWIFFSEGIQKLIEPVAMGAGRFAKIGIPWPEVMGPFVGTVELICGLLVIVGLFTRIAAIPLAVTMIVAIVSTKIPILLGYGFCGFNLRDLPSYGFWRMAHESRTDLAMLLGSLFLVMVGAGRLSLDARFTAEKKG